MDGDDSDDSIIYLGETRTVYPKSTEDGDNFFGRAKPLLMKDFWKDFNDSESPMRNLIPKTTEVKIPEKILDLAKYGAYGEPRTSVWIPCLPQREETSSIPVQDVPLDKPECEDELTVNDLLSEEPEINFGSLCVKFEDEDDDDELLPPDSSTSEHSSGSVSDLCLSSPESSLSSISRKSECPHPPASQCSTISLSVCAGEEAAEEDVPEEDVPKEDAPSKRGPSRRSCRSLYKTPPSLAQPPPQRSSPSSKRSRALSEEWRSGRLDVDANQQKNAQTACLDPLSHIGPCTLKCLDKQKGQVLDPEVKDRPSSKKKFLLCEDISKGQELFPVRVWNNVNDEKLPKFKYICGLIDEPDHQRKPCVCQCKEFCNARCFCMNEPFLVTESDVAYDAKTRLLRNPSGWVNSIIPNSPRSIWECSPTCPCGSSCMNRSAQLGLRYPFEIFMTPTKGWGVRSLRALPAGAFVAEYAGKVKQDDPMSYWTEATWYTFSLVSGPVKGRRSKTEYFLDASKKGNLTRFINHGCVPNCVAINVFWDDTDPKRGMHVGIYTVRKIQPGQELTLDYSATFWKAKAEAGEYCHCGSRKCLYAEPKTGKRKMKQAGLSKKGKPS